MKKNRLPVFLMVLILGIILPAGLFGQVQEEDEPMQAIPDPRAWEQLPKMEMLKTLGVKEMLKGQAWQFDLNNIKQALVKARIQEPVTIEYVSLKGMVYNLGTYAPALKKVVGFKDKNNMRYINPQPEPPGFPTIPSIKQVAQSTAMLLKDPRWNGKSVLIFKDAAGQVKAAVELYLPPRSIVEPSKKDMNTHF